MEVSCDHTCPVFWLAKLWPEWEWWRPLQTEEGGACAVCPSTSPSPASLCLTSTVWICRCLNVHPGPGQSQLKSRQQGRSALPQPQSNLLTGPSSKPQDPLQAVLPPQVQERRQAFRSLEHTNPLASKPSYIGQAGPSTQRT